MSAITIRAERYGDRVSVTYIGHPDDLVALGYPTAEMLEAGKRGRRRPDPQGRPFGRSKHANGRVTISVFACPILDALRLPGVFKALDEQAAYEPELEGIDIGPLLDRFKRGLGRVSP